MALKSVTSLNPFPDGFGTNVAGEHQSVQCVTRSIIIDLSKFLLNRSASALQPMGVALGRTTFRGVTDGSLTNVISSSGPRRRGLPNKSSLNSQKTWKSTVI